MKLFYVCAHQVTDAGDLFVELIQSLCDLPHAATQAYVLIPELCDKLHEILPCHVTEGVCEHLSKHVGYYIQYVTHPDQYTLISWSQTTREFLDQYDFDRTFCDLWRAHVHLLMLHAQANWDRKWDQEQSCWYKHNDVCELLQVQFKTWLQNKSFEQAVTVN